MAISDHLPTHRPPTEALPQTDEAHGTDPAQIDPLTELLHAKERPDFFDEEGITLDELETYLHEKEDNAKAIEVAQETRLQRAMHVGKRAVQSMLITLEVLPTNGLITLGVPAAVFAATKSVPLASAAAGLLTGGLEAGAGLSTSDILSNSPDNRVVQKAKDLLDTRTARRLLLMRDGKLPLPVESVVALYVGTPGAMLAREADVDAPERTQQERSRRTLITAAALGVICTAQAALYTEAASSVMEGDPKKLIPIAAAGVGYKVWSKRTKGRIMAEKAEQESNPRYDLTEREFKFLESDLVADVDKQSKEGLRRRKKPGVYAVWMKPDNKYANILRTREAEYFPEVKELPPEVEEDTMFLAMVDTRKGSKRVVHGTTISGIDKDPEALAAEGKTGFTTIDELIEIGNFTAAEFQDYYKQAGVDTRQSISVDTNFRTGKAAEKLDGLKTSDLAYLTLFQELQRRTPEGVNTAVFASINQNSIDSFRRIGLECQPLMGRNDLVTPESTEEGKDVFLPVVIPLNDSSRALFKAMDYEVPEINLT